MLQDYTLIQKRASELGCSVTKLCKLAGMQPSKFYRHKSRPELVMLDDLKALNGVLEALENH